MARLVEFMLNGTASTAGRDREQGRAPSAVLAPESIARVTGVGEFDLAGLGLQVHVRQTDDGMCVQVADVTGGCGCLMRWYPEHGNGVVILFNSETGPEAALRIAQLALGGR
jgi:hypothetical protein